jgi:Ricin-type beta-trefoil lectin domain-like
MKKSVIFIISVILFFSSPILAQLANGHYLIRLDASGLVLDAESANFRNNGCNIQLWQQRASDNQVWYITKVSGNNYIITLFSSGLALDAASETFNKNGGKVQLWQNNGGSTQIWTIKPLTNGKYHIYLAKTGKGLDADNDFIRKNGCKIQLWDKSEKNKNQIWNIVLPPLWYGSLKGRWSPKGETKPAVISLSNENITIDMSQYNRPNATGIGLNGATIKVTFPDINQTLTGTIIPASTTSAGQIRWSNGKIWEKWVD